MKPEPKQFSVLATHFFTFLLFSTKMNFRIREIRNHYIAVKCYISACDASLKNCIKSLLELIGRFPGK